MQLQSQKEGFLQVECQEASSLALILMLKATCLLVDPPDQEEIVC